MIITDAKAILDALNSIDSGHFMVETPDGERDDFDTVIPDYWVKSKFGKDFSCNDSNGSDPWRYHIVDDKVFFALDVCDREYENSKCKIIRWENKILVCGVKELHKSENGIVIVVDSVEEKKIKQEILDRWFERIFGMNLCNDVNGGYKYLEKYGKKISEKKVQELVECAITFGYDAFAESLNNAWKTRNSCE